MPTYEYRCKDCGHQFDVVQSFTDDALTVCPECQGNLKKVFGNVGITFKGGGFYKTDSRAAAPTADSSSSSSTSSSTSSSSSTSEGSGGSGSGDSSKSTTASTSSSA